MNRIREGAAGFVNPFNGGKYSASLRPDDVLFIVFWSKNFAPFLECLNELDRMGYQFYFQFTITGHPEVLERSTPPWREAVETARYLAERFSPERVLWRFDPIVFCSVTPPEQVFVTFEQLAAALEGATLRCYLSFVFHYGKVRRNFEVLHLERGITFRAGPEEFEKMKGGRNGEAFVFDLSREEKTCFARELSRAARKRGISLHSCCGDFFVNNSEPEIYKAHCVDGELVKKMLGEDRIEGGIKPTRGECGCWESIDIGAYDTCPHGCLYCYANTNKRRAAENHNELINNKGAFSMHARIDESQFPSLRAVTTDLP